MVYCSRNPPLGSSLKPSGLVKIRLIWSHRLDPPCWTLIIALMCFYFKLEDWYHVRDQSGIAREGLAVYKHSFHKSSHSSSALGVARGWDNQCDMSLHSLQPAFVYDRGRKLCSILFVSVYCDGVRSTCLGAGSSTCRWQRWWPKDHMRRKPPE